MEKIFRFAVEEEFEAIGEEGAQHDHLLVVGGLLFAGCESDDVVVI